MFKIFRACFLYESIRSGHIHPECLNIAGDGTPVVTAARFRSHHTCDCWKKASSTVIVTASSPSRIAILAGIPPASFGTSGTTCTSLPMLTANYRSSRLYRASLHDSHGFCEAFFRFRALAPDLKPASLLLDSAHDSMSMYRFCQQEGITPYIDLNLGNTKKTTDYHGVTLGPDGIPICSASLKMKSNGNDLNRQYAKFRYPLNNNGTCTCQTPCPDAKFGRTCSVAMESNIRLYTSPPRSSDVWKLMYNKHTTSEHVNKRIKLDYMLEACKHRCNKYWYARVYLIMMLFHLSKWKVQ